MSSLTLRRETPSVLSLTGLFRFVAHWTEVRRSRIALARLDGHLLEDIGLDAAGAQSEARRWFGQN